MTGRSCLGLSSAPSSPGGRLALAIDWPALRAAALAAAGHAYAPYSRLQVGAAGQVEGDSEGGMGGESEEGVGRRGGGGAPLAPCGRCRQLLLEAGGPGLLVDTESGPREIHALLPSAFTGADL